MNEPTDKELITLRQECRDDPRSEEEHWFILFARAVLAKWGNPAPVAGEPVAWLSTDSIGERYLCFTKPNDSDPVRPLVFGDTTPQPTQAQAGAGTWAHLKLMMEESAWDGTLQLSDALANIDDFAAAHPSPPEGMVGGWIASKDQMPPPGVRVFWGDVDSHRVGYDSWAGDDYRWAPSHWMPLPPPPTTSAGSGKGE